MQDKRKDRSHLIQLAKDHEAEINKLPENYHGYFPDEPELISAENWIESYRTDKNIITVDVRSEDEFLEDHLPGAINFPILNNSERDEVGFLYKQVSPQAALFLALKTADGKADKISSFCAGLKAKEIFVYCWRGGGRSSAACHYFSQHGIKCTKIIEGYKSYRHQIYKLFYENPTSLNFVVLSGLTGCGKTQIIEDLTDKVPVFDIEKAAGHASSLFGHIRFEVKTDDIPQNQLQFENRLFEQIISVKKSAIPFITESESKRISKFNIPDRLYERLLESPVIEVKSDMTKRVERIRAEYFSDGIGRAYLTVERSEFLLKVLGHEKINELLGMLKAGKIDEFCEWFLKEYYDKRYATKFNKIIATIEHNDLIKASDEILKHLV
ncbi:MAG: tRNA 2-selenouridine(34) synthase MnmH [Candidatus Delongbacteria bacterium GWF2_40_14]|nr:MAG: tRNA 2-selenouridine(34) synthase MnmH [Candidatus Delongbacteria bacterium GWF2_40_14]